MLTQEFTTKDVEDSHLASLTSNKERVVIGETVCLMSDCVLLTRKEYDELMYASDFLDCLYNNGVDNWEGFSFAEDEYRKGIYV